MLKLCNVLIESNAILKNCQRILNNFHREHTTPHFGLTTTFAKLPETHKNHAVKIEFS